LKLLFYYFGKPGKPLDKLENKKTKIITDKNFHPGLPTKTVKIKPKYLLKLLENLVSLR